MFKLRLTLFAPFAILGLLSAPVLSHAQTCEDAFIRIAPAPRTFAFDQLHTKYVAFAEQVPVGSYTIAIGENVYIDPRGQEVGRALVFKLNNANVDQFARERTELKPYKTEIDDMNRDLCTKLGFIESSDMQYGRFMSQVPSPALFEYLRSRYNETVEPDFQIHVGLYASKTLSSKQTEIVRHWVLEAKQSFGDARLGSVAGLKPADLAKPVVKEMERLSVYRHDWEHFASIALVTSKIVDTNRRIGVFWHRVLERMHEAEAKGLVPPGFREGSEFRSIMDAAYTYTRRFHSLTHVLGMLARNDGAIDINQHRIVDMGQSARDETPTVHWTGLGYRPNWITEKDLPSTNRLFRMSFDLAQTTDKPVTIADAYDAVTNQAALQALDFAIAHSREFPKSVLGRDLQQLIKESGIESAFLSREELAIEQQLTLQRYLRMGAFARRKPGADEQTILSSRLPVAIEKSDLQARPYAPTSQKILAETLRRLFSGRKFDFLPFESRIAIHLNRSNQLQISSVGLSPDLHAQFIETLRSKDALTVISRLPELMRSKFFEVTFQTGPNGRRSAEAQAVFARDVSFPVVNPLRTGFGLNSTSIIRPYIESEKSPFEIIRPDLMRQTNIQETFATCGLAAVLRVLRARGVVTSEKELRTLLSEYEIKRLSELFGKNAGIGLPEITALLSRLGEEFGFTVRETRVTGLNDLESFDRVAQQAAGEGTIDVIVNFGSPQVGRPGAGHFVPVGGYNTITREILVSEINENMNPAFWVHQANLIDGMAAIGTGGTPRGYLVLDWKKRNEIRENKRAAERTVESFLPERLMTPVELGQRAKDFALSKTDEILEALKHVQPRPGKLTAVKLAENKFGSLWAHIWDGVPTDVHDHREFDSGQYVLRGTLYEDVFTPPNPNPQTRIYKEGDIFVQGGEHFVHRVRGDGAISVHAYGPSPLFILYQTNPANGRLELISGNSN